MRRANLQNLEARLAALEDERAIRDVIGRYGHYADLGHEEAWVDQFTEDGVYDLVTIVRKGAGYNGIMRFVGREQLFEHIRDPAAHKQLEGRSLHIQDMNLVVHVTGDMALAESYSMTLLREGDETVVRSAGMIRWSLRRMRNRWLIMEKRRRPPGDPDLFAGIEQKPAGILPD